jgi:hypothetical protein
MTEPSNGQDTDSDLDASTDPLYEQVVMFVLKTGRPSVGLVQRHFKIGINLARRMLDAMEHNGIVSAVDAAGNRSVLILVEEPDMSDVNSRPMKPSLSLAAKSLVVPFGLALLAGLSYAISKFSYTDLLLESVSLSCLLWLLACIEGSDIELCSAKRAFGLVLVGTPLICGALSAAKYLLGLANMLLSAKLY